MGSFHGHERALLLAASGQNGLAIDSGAMSTFDKGKVSIEFCRKITTKEHHASRHGHEAGLMLSELG
jgi:hypothetical protein